MLCFSLAKYAFRLSSETGSCKCGEKYPHFGQYGGKLPTTQQDAVVSLFWQGKQQRLAASSWLLLSWLSASNN